MTTLLCLLCQSSALLLLGLLALRLTQKRGPAVQTLIGRASLVGVALLLLLAPLTGHVQPVMRVPEPTPQQAAILPQREGAEAENNIVRAPLAASSIRAGAISTSADVPTSTSTLLPPKPAVPSETLRPPGTGGRTLALRVASAAPGGFFAFGGFFFVSALLLFWLGICQWNLTGLRRDGRAVTTGPAIMLLAELTPTPPCLLSHPSVHSPFLAGYHRSTIFMPATFESDFNADALRAIFVHELAHRDRRDNFWTLAARLLSALLWPQPLLWLLVRRLEHISEDACDEAVLAHNCPPRAYADCLLSLATRPSGRREHALSTGVAPFRSSLGRRISEVLSTTRRLPAPPTRLFRVSTGFCTLLAVAGSVLLLNADAAVDLSHFIWAKQQGWPVRPIRIVDLDHPGLTRVASLPYDISEQDKATVAQISHLSENYGVQPVTEKVHLEALLAAQPHFFYAEYLLGSWYRQHGDPARAAALQAQALCDAPVVLAGRYEYDDGTPVAGLRIGTTIMCYDPAHLKAKAAEFQHVAVRLDYENVVTDADGCYYLPVFQAIYSQQGVNWGTDQLNALTASHFKAHADLITPGPATSGINSSGGEEHLGTGFTAESHVAVLPQTQVRPVVALNSPFNGSLGTMDKPMPLHGSVLPFSWQPYPKAAQYVVRVYENRSIYDDHGLAIGGWASTQLQTDASNSARLGLPLTRTSVTLNLAGLDPVFNRTYSYSVTVEAQDQNGETISHSDQYYFKPLNALAPQPLTKAALAQALGAGFVVKSIQSQKDQVIATVLTPPSVPWTFATDKAVEASGRRFGLGSYAGWSSSPGISMNEVNPAHIMRITYQKND